MHDVRVRRACRSSRSLGRPCVAPKQQRAVLSVPPALLVFQRPVELRPWLRAVRTRSGRTQFRPAVDKAIRPCKVCPTAARLSCGDGGGRAVSTARSLPPDAESAASEDGPATWNAPGGRIPARLRQASWRVQPPSGPLRSPRRRAAAARSCCRSREYPARLPRKFGPSGAVARHLGPPALHTPARVASWGEPRFSHGRGAGCWCHGRPPASAPCQRAQGRSRPATTAGASRHRAMAMAGRSACQLAHGGRGNLRPPGSGPAAHTARAFIRPCRPP